MIEFILTHVSVKQPIALSLSTITMKYDYSQTSQERIIDMIRSHPGIKGSEIAKELGYRKDHVSSFLYTKWVIKKYGISYDNGKWYPSPRKVSKRYDFDNRRWSEDRRYVTERALERGVFENRQPWKEDVANQDTVYMSEGVNNDTARDDRSQTGQPKSPKAISDLTRDEVRNTWRHWNKLSPGQRQQLDSRYSYLQQEEEKRIRAQQEHERKKAEEREYERKQRIADQERTARIRSEQEDMQRRARQEELREAELRNRQQEQDKVARELDSRRNELAKEEERIRRIMRMSVEQLEAEFHSEDYELRLTDNEKALISERIQNLQSRASLSARIPLPFRVLAGMFLGALLTMTILWPITMNIQSEESPKIEPVTSKSLRPE